ncbi:MAG: prepilin peptidase [Polyangia bacterium]
MPDLAEAGALWSEFLRSPLGAALATVWGTLWGSFANVCISRIPAGESVVRPASRCPSCQAAIAWYDNIPLVSWLVLRARCRRCRAPISARYFVVEALSGLLALLVYLRFVREPGVALPLGLARFVVYFALAGVLLVLAAIDLELKLLPDRITYPAIPSLFLAGRLLADVSALDAALGAAAGYLGVRLLSDGYYYLTGREGLGYGDGKLLALIGAALGWQALPVVLLVGSLSGLVVGIPFLLIQRRRAALLDEEPPASGAPSVPVPTDLQAGDEADAEPDGPPPLRHAALPFGPFLALGAVLHLLVLHGRSETEVLLRLARLLGMETG